MTPIFALVLGLSTPFDPAGHAGWAEFGVKPSLRQSEELVQIGTIPGKTEPGEYAYWLRHTRTTAGVQTVRFTDTASCPAANEVLARIEAFEIPSATAPHNWQNIVITMDGARYHMKAPLRFGDRTGSVSLESNVQTPLAEFVNANLKALENCWSEELPSRG